MNPDTPDIPPSPIKEASAAAVGGVAPVVAPPVVHARHPVSWMSVLALVVAALSLVLAGLIWQKLGFTQQELARQMVAYWSSFIHTGRPAGAGLQVWADVFGRRAGSLPGAGVTWLADVRRRIE